MMLTCSQTSALQSLSCGIVSSCICGWWTLRLYLVSGQRFISWASPSMDKRRGTGCHPRCSERYFQTFHCKLKTCLFQPVARSSYDVWNFRLTLFFCTLHTLYGSTPIPRTVTGFLVGWSWDLCSSRIKEIAEGEGMKCPRSTSVWVSRFSTGILSWKQAVFECANVFCTNSPNLQNSTRPYQNYWKSKFSLKWKVSDGVAV